MTRTARVESIPLFIPDDESKLCRGSGSLPFRPRVGNLRVFERKQEARNDILSDEKARLDVSRSLFKQVLILII